MGIPLKNSQKGWAEETMKTMVFEKKKKKGSAGNSQLPPCSIHSLKSELLGWDRAVTLVRMVDLQCSNWRHRHIQLQLQVLVVTA